MVMLTKPKDVIKALTGSWIYLNVTTYYDNGTIANRDEPGLGRTPAGLLTYTSEGFMSANFMSSRPEDRPGQLDTTELEGAEEEWALIGKHTLAYAGPYYVSVTTSEVETGQITHGPAQVAWLPSWVGKEIRKNYTLLDERATLRLVARTNDDVLVAEMYFRKLLGLTEN